MNSEGDNRGRGFGMNIPKPVKVGDELEVSIEAVASKGDGIAKKDGFVIFVPGAKSGENIKVRVTNVKRTCAEAERVDGSEESSAPDTTETASEEPTEETEEETSTEEAVEEEEKSE